MDIGLGLSENHVDSLRSATTLPSRGVALDQKDPLAHAVLGRSQYYAGNFASSVETLNRAVALSPNLAYAYFGRGYTLAMSDRHREAIPDFEMAERLSPADPLLWSYYSLRAWAHLNLGDLDEAIHWARRCASLPNSTFWPYCTLALTYHLKNDIEAAQKARETLFAMRPDFTLAFVKKAVPMADSEAARSLFAQMIEAGIPER